MVFGSGFKLKDSRFKVQGFKINIIRTSSLVIRNLIQGFFHYLFINFFPPLPFTNTSHGVVMDNGH